MNKTVGQILDRLIDEPFFYDFKIRKSDECLINKSKNGFKKISLEDHYQSIDLNNKRLGLQVRPYVEIRYDILSKWFEKYSFIDLKTQRSNGQIFEHIGGFGKVEFLFYNEGDCFEEHYNKIRDYIVSESALFFEKYSTMEKLYINKIIPLMTGEKQFWNNGGDWMFEYLKLVWIVDKPNYPKFKEKIMKHINFLMFGRSSQEPNIAKYYNRLEEIFADLERD